MSLGLVLKPGLLLQHQMLLDDPHKGLALGEAGGRGAVGGGDFSWCHDFWLSCMYLRQFGMTIWTLDPLFVSGAGNEAYMRLHGMALRAPLN